MSRAWDSAKAAEFYERYMAASEPVEPAQAGEPLCGKMHQKGDADGPCCGGECVRKAEHEGLCLCAGDDDNVPGTCPAA